MRFDPRGRPRLRTCAAVAALVAVGASPSMVLATSSGSGGDSDRTSGADSQVEADTDATSSTDAEADAAAAEVADVAAGVVPVDVPPAAPENVAADVAPLEGPAAAAEVADVAAAVAPTPLSRLAPVTPAGQQFGYLQDTATGQRFTLRGANFVRVASPGVPTPEHHYHSTFEPGRYTTGEAEHLLASMERDGYNAVRVFIDQGSITDAWTWNAADTPSLATIYTYADQRGAINGQLAPIVRPDPCRVR